MASAGSIRPLPAALVAAAVFCAGEGSLALGAAGCDDGPGVATNQTGPSDGVGGRSGGGGSAGGGTVKPASFTIYADRGGCPTVTPNDTTADSSYVVQWTIVDECTGLGGQHVIAEDVDGTRQFFLGGHGCYELPAETFPTFPTPALRYGVLRGRQTAALLTAGPCVAFPEDPPMPSPNPTKIESIQSDTTAVLLEAYETLADARAAR